MCARMTTNPHDRVGYSPSPADFELGAATRGHWPRPVPTSNHHKARPGCKLRRATRESTVSTRHIFCLFAQTLKHLKHSLPSLDLKVDPQRVNRYEAAFSLFVAAGCDSGLCRANPAPNIPVNGPAEQLQVDLRTTQHAARCCPVDAPSFNPPTAKIGHSKKGSARENVDLLESHRRLSTIARCDSVDASTHPQSFNLLWRLEWFPTPIRGAQSVLLRSVVRHQSLHLALQQSDDIVRTDRTLADLRTSLRTSFLYSRTQATSRLSLHRGGRNNATYCTG